jgi:hypothetical protein
MSKLRMMLRELATETAAKAMSEKDVKYLQCLAVAMERIAREIEEKRENRLHE